MAIAVPHYGILFLKILGRLDQLSSLRRKSTAHLKHLIPTRQSCKASLSVMKEQLSHLVKFKVYFLMDLNVSFANQEPRRESP